MKIVVATTTGFHLRHCVHQLDARGHDVTFLSYLPAWKTLGYGIENRSTYSLFWRLQPYTSIALWRGGGARIKKIREDLLEKTDKAIAKVLPSCDVFIGLSSVTVESARAARDRYGATVIIERGSSHVLEQARLASKEKPLSDLYIQRELASYDQADYVVVPSRFAEKTFLAEGINKNRIQVINLGVDTKNFSMSQQPPAMPVKALFVGQWSYRKGADLMSAAIERCPELDLTHIGLCVDEPLPRHSRFRTLGYQNHSNLQELMQKFHLLLLPSREDGFGMVMTEALASGLRIVASDTTGAPDLEDAVGMQHVKVFESGSLSGFVNAIRDQIQSIENDPIHYRPRDSDIEKLSWAKYGDRYENFLRKLEG